MMAGPGGGIVTINNTWKKLIRNQILIVLCPRKNMGILVGLGTGFGAIGMDFLKKIDNAMILRIDFKSIQSGFEWWVACP